MTLGGGEGIVIGERDGEVLVGTMDMVSELS